MKKSSTKLTLIPEAKNIIDQLSQGNALTQQQEYVLRALLPKWIPDRENIGTAMMQTGQEFIILIEQLLEEEGWSEKQIVNFEKKIKKVLPVLHEMEIKRNLSILSSNDMRKVGDIAEKRYNRLDESDKKFFLGVGQKIKQLKEGKK